MIWAVERSSTSAASVAGRSRLRRTSSSASMACRSTRRSGVCAIGFGVESASTGHRRSSGWRNGRTDGGRDRCSEERVSMVTNLADPKVRLQLMQAAVAELSKEPHAFVLAHLILTSVDGLSRSPIRATTVGFQQMLPLVLPQLANHISPADITAFIRGKTVHEFGIAPPYAIGWGRASYVEDRVVHGENWKIIDVQQMAAARSLRRYKSSVSALQGGRCTPPRAPGRSNRPGEARRPPPALRSGPPSSRTGTAAATRHVIGSIPLPSAGSAGTWRRCPRSSWHPACR